MQHDDWANELNRLLRSKKATRGDWDELVSQTDEARRSSVNDWHLQQVRGIYAEFLRENDELDTSAKLHEQIGDDAEDSIRYWHTAAGSALAQAALDHFKLGNKSEAVLLAKRALSHLGKTADPAPIYEKLISTLRAHLEDSR